MRAWALLLAAILAAVVQVADPAQGAGPGEGRGGWRAPGPESVFLTETPPHPGSVIVARPTTRSVTLSLLWSQAAEGLLVWGRDPERLPAEGLRVALRAHEPVRVELDGLTPDTAYAYALLDAATRRRLLPVDGPGAFRTARGPGQPFTFAVQADSHLDAACGLDLYARTLASIRADAPDFLLDLGDTFMTDKHPSPDSAARQYAAQRYHLGLVGQSAALFLALGNHDGEGLDGSGNPARLASWAHRMRTRYFANPAPNAFYSGNAAPHPAVGLLENYYAWAWGDALFVVLDPYWTSRPTHGGRAPWNLSLGDAQREWLARTLRASSARFKFLFVHQLTGSAHPSGRGGAEAAAYQEWGGQDLDGRDGLAAHRPGWETAIHRLLVESGVTAVFHGHDHFYARQARDGVVYQLVPQPAHRNARDHHAEEYGYREGDFLAGSGYLRVRVGPDAATVEYVRTVSPGRAGPAVAASYTLSPRPGTR